MIREYLKLSRPRFWPYLFGPLLIGIGITGLAYEQPLLTLILCIYFTFPANLLLYGINDYFDTDTDAHNEKKSTYETRLSKNRRQTLRTILLALIISTIVIAAALPTLGATIIFLTWLSLSILYSTPPIRFKARPFIDSASNILYVLPALIPLAVHGTQISWSAVLGAGLWTAAMHLYSAVPDIDADKSAHLLTTAVLLGRRGSLILCAILWTVATLIAHHYLGNHGFIGIVYPLLALSALIGPDTPSRIYRYFPAINFCVGLLLYLTLS